MTNNDVLSEMDNAAEETTNRTGATIFIKIVNAGTNSNIEDVELEPANQLGQVAKAYGLDINIDFTAPLTFYNKRTGESTSKLEMTLKAFGICDGDTLLISDTGTVA